MMSKQLLVEGNDDLHVVSALCKKYKIPENFEVIDKKGKDNLFKGLPEIVKGGNIDTLGVVLDADLDVSKRWGKVKRIFEQFDYQLPAAITPNGLIRTHPDNETFYPIKIGVWLMPNNETSGILEDFMQLLIDEKKDLWNLTLETVEKVEQKVKESERFALKDRSKALIHTYLAWQKDPGKPMGEAITKKYFDADAALAKLFVQWLNDLFNKTPDNQ